MAENWSLSEVAALVADYFVMLDLELRGLPFNKTAHRVALKPLLHGRSDGSIEKKRQNVSAILIEQGHPYIDGYKPLPNYQGLLLDVVSDRLDADAALRVTVTASVAAPVAVPSVEDLLDRWEDPPEPVAPVAYPLSLKERPARRGRRVNYLAMEASNTHLGRAGELFALNYERARLIRAGAASLSDATYHLYRIFRFRANPRLFGLKGALDETCRLVASQYSAQVK